MTLQASGRIDLSDINVELGNSATDRISLGNSLVRTLLSRETGSISIGDGYGKSVASSGVFVPGDRGQGRTKVLIVAPDADAVGGLPRSQGIPNISGRETAAGYTVDTLTSYTAFEALTDPQLFQYMHIWDIGFQTAVPSGSQAQYVKYLTQGGAVWWSGENNSFAGFQVKNNSIVAMLTTLGAGTVVRDSYNVAEIGHATIEPEFRLSNSASTTTFNYPSYWNAWGTGTPMCYKSGSTTLSPVVVWKTGSLTNAPKGCCVAIMDINWLDDANKDNNFIDNLVQVLNTK